MSNIPRSKLRPPTKIGSLLPKPPTRVEKGTSNVPINAAPTTARGTSTSTQVNPAVPASIQNAVKKTITKKTTDLKQKSDSQKTAQKPTQLKQPSQLKKPASEPKNAKTAEEKEAAKKAEKEKKEEQEIKAYNDFMSQFEAAVALLPTLPYRFRKQVNNWLNRLVKQDDTPQITRNLYLSFLVFQISKLKIIIEPFDQNPPEKLENAAKFFSIIRWKEFLDKYKGEQPLVFIPGINEENRCETKPDEFFNELPTPNNGLVAYGSVFSNHFN